MTHPIFIIIEKQGDSFRKASIEALCEGRRLADLKGTSLTAVVLGADVTKPAADLAKFGADEIFVVENDFFTQYPTDPYCHVIENLIKARLPETVLISATLWGKEIAAKLASKLDVPLAMDCVAIDVTQNDLVCERFLFGGKVKANVWLAGDTRIIATRPNTIVIKETPGKVVPRLMDVDVALPKVRLVDLQLDPANKMDLTEANVVVSGGRGTNGNYSAIEDLAKVLGGAVGASRSSVDEGWRPHEDQIGQTGKVVSPNLYIACGISGSIQHIAGMSTSKYVIAINNDPDASIFERSDYGIVGDLHETIPALTEAVKNLQQDQ